MLAVVEHDQHVLGPQEVDEAVLDRSPQLLGDAERGGHGLDQGIGNPDRRQLAEPATIAMRGRDGGRGLQREPGLADTAHAGQRHDAALLQSLDGRSKLAFTAHEAGRLDREVSRVRVE
jgi:hypothetical protein